MQTGTMIGIRMPKVPQAVPIAKERNAAIAKTSAGSRKPGKPPFSTRPLTNSPVMSRSRQTPLIVQARMRMMSAGTIDLTPSPMPAMKSL